MFKKFKNLNWQKGFTLIELVMVVAILGLLLAIVVPRVAKFRENAILSADRATAASIAKTAELYAISENLSEEDKEDSNIINIRILEKENYLDKDTKPQNREYNKFLLAYKDGRFIVSYNEGATLYPLDNSNKD